MTMFSAALKPRPSLTSFSTPGFGKKKPPAPKVSAAESQLSYISISSTDTTPVRDPSSSVPVKRTSSDSVLEIDPEENPKRMRVDPHTSGKENTRAVDYKGKGREKPAPSSPVLRISEIPSQASSSIQSSGSINGRTLPLDYSDLLTVRFHESLPEPLAYIEAANDIGSCWRAVNSP